jgi:OPT family oligopeptide transporter
LVFVIPVGIIKAMTGIEVTLNVLAEFVGGSFVEGNALAMNYFKSFGYVTCAHAVWFSNDLKLAHYVKIPPRHTFMAQMVATFVGTLVCVGVLNFQLRHINAVCTPDAQFRLTCPGVNTFFTASVLWGTVGPTKIWGSNGQYTETLIGFPMGVIIVFIFWGLSKKFPNWTWVRQIHPVAIMYGGIVWAPYNMSYVWPSVPIAYVSWIYLKSRFLGLWSKVSNTASNPGASGPFMTSLLIFCSSTTLCSQPPGPAALPSQASLSSSHCSGRRRSSRGGAILRHTTAVKAMLAHSRLSSPANTSAPKLVTSTDSPPVSNSPFSRMAQGWHFFF